MRPVSAEGIATSMSSLTSSGGMSPTSDDANMRATITVSVFQLNSTFRQTSLNVGLENISDRMLSYTSLPAWDGAMITYGKSVTHRAIKQGDYLTSTILLIITSFPAIS